MESSNNTGKVIGVLLAGVALGGILGVLFAPHKGTKTRRKIAKSSEEAMQSFKEKLESLFDEAKAAFEAKMEQNEDASINETKA